MIDLLDAITGAHRNGGDEIRVPAGLHVLPKLPLYPKVHITGAGPETTLIVQEDGADCDFAVTEGFEDLSGSNSSAGAFAWSLSNLSIDGNMWHQKHGGRALALYGYDFSLSNLRIRNFRAGGIYSEWCDNVGLPYPNDMAAYLDKVKVGLCGSHGIQWAGPHDSVFTGVMSYCNNGTGIWISRDPQGRETSNGMQLDSCHVYGPGHAIAYKLDGLALLSNVSGDLSGEGTIIDINYPWCGINGGWITGQPGFPIAGVRIGPQASNCKIDLAVRDCQAGGLALNSQGYNNVRMHVYQSNPAPAMTGSILSTDTITISKGGQAYSMGPISLTSR